MYRTLWRKMPRALRRRVYPRGVLRIPIDADHPFSMICTGEYIENDVYRWGLATVLRGMQGVLAPSRPTVLMEVLTDAAGAAELEPIKTYGYEMFRVHENDGLEPISTLGGQVRGSRNVLLCRPEAFETAGLQEFLVA